MTSKRRVASRVDPLVVTPSHSALAKTAPANPFGFCSYKKPQGGPKPVCRQPIADPNVIKLR